MFGELQQRTRRLDGARIATVCLHCLLLYLLVRPMKPIFVTPSSVAYGNHGKNEIVTPIYFTQSGDTASSDDAERRIFLAKREAKLRRNTLKRRRKHKKKRRQRRLTARARRMARCCKGRWMGMMCGRHCP